LTPELLSPAGDWECLRAAVANGADAVYLGLPRFNARMRADNFREEEVPAITDYCHRHGVKVYVTMNVLIFPSELEDALSMLRTLDQGGVDAVILQDVGLVEAARQLVPNLRIHASTQMTITSPEGALFAKELGASQVVLARELSMRELEKFPVDLPLEVFVHGALCVAYSGQCLTSEALGQRSANRGECAQACRLPYTMVVDGKELDLGDRKYLLSPQDLAGLREIPRLIQLGIRSFKIEGRLKSPEYVAAVTAVYRKAMDHALAGEGDPAPSGADKDWYSLEMTFSRGLSPGWLHGVNHQELVGARYGKKRGAFCGRVSRSGRGWFELESNAARLKPGDGIVIDTGGDTDREEGGRIQRVNGNRFYLAREKAGLVAPPGGRIWKTSDPALDRELRKSYQSRVVPREERKAGLRVRVTARPGKPLQLFVESKNKALICESKIPLEPAKSRPLTPESLRDQFDRLGGTPWRLESFVCEMEKGLMLPWSEFGRMRREVLTLLSDGEASPAPAAHALKLQDLLIPSSGEQSAEAGLSVLCRTMEQLETACRMGISLLYVDLEDIRRGKEAVALVRDLAPSSRIFLATPRIQKAGEAGFFKLQAGFGADGFLVRNPGAITFCREQGIRMHGDFSLNVANGISVAVFLNRGLERLTVSYDLNAGQVLELARSSPVEALELTLHQHIPMFHMEHCAFAAFLSDGTDHTNCGRPCEKHHVTLRDRTGMAHPLKADVGCRNTLFHAVAQSGAAYYQDFLTAGFRHFRVELLEESTTETTKVLTVYQDLIEGKAGSDHVWRELRARSQLGVTLGTLLEK
jgi:putative protease